MTMSTRQRMLDAAVELFAVRGYDGTAVGDIEEAAGLTRRGGAFYRHFPSKLDVLHAVVDRHASTATETKQLVDLLRLGDRRAELILLGRLLLAELDNQRSLHRLLDRDGDRVADARDRMANDVLHTGYRHMSAVFARWLKGKDTIDVDAFTVVALGGLVNLRRNKWTFGTVPLHIDDERALAVWATMTDIAIEGLQPKLPSQGSAGR